MQSRLESPGLRQERTGVARAMVTWVHRGRGFEDNVEVRVDGALSASARTIAGSPVDNPPK